MKTDFCDQPKQIYKRMLDAMLDAINDDELGISLRTAQIETIAEIASDEAENMIRESVDALKTRINNTLERFDG
jgi:hypothetical protein